MVKSGSAAALPLDPGDYGGTYKLVGARLCLDFINTVSYPHSEAPHDWFDPPSNVVDWARAVGLIEGGGAAERRLRRRVRYHRAETGRSLARMREARAALRRVLEPLAGGDRPGRRDVVRFNDLLAAASPYRRIDPAVLDWVWEPPIRLHHLTRPVVLDAADLLTHGDHSRLGWCPGCHWLFLDTTRNGRRRWCDMADCGSRDKALRYYHRTKASTSRR